MYCPNCGNSVDDNAAFCVNCGTKLATNTQTNEAQPQEAQQQEFVNAANNNEQPYGQPYQQQYEQPYQQPYQQPYEQPYQQPYGQPYDSYQPGFAPPMPMKWFKFLIYFSLFASAVLNIINGFQLITGAQYEGSADLVYSMYEGLKTVDMLVGVAGLGLAALAIYTRIRLAGFFKNGPTMITIFYIAIAVINFINIVGYAMILPEEIIQDLNFSSVAGQIISSIILVITNNIYFKKRAHLFTK